MQVGYNQNIAFGQNRATVGRKLSEAVKKYPENYEQAVQTAARDLLKQDAGVVDNIRDTLHYLEGIAMRKRNGKRPETRQQSDIIRRVVRFHDRADFIESKP